MEQRAYRAWPSPALLAAMLAILLVGLSSVLVGELQPWLLAAYALAVIGLALQLVQNWRWRLATDDEGITVDSGFGNRERVGWREIEAIRTWPPAVRPRSGRRIRLLLQPRKLRELERLAADAQGEPEGTLLEGSDRLSPARAFMFGSAPRFLFVVLVGASVATLLTVLTDGVARQTAAATGLEHATLRWAVPVLPLAYCAFLLFARSLRAIVIGSLAAVGALAVVATALWGLGPVANG